MGRPLRGQLAKQCGLSTFSVLSTRSDRARDNARLREVEKQRPGRGREIERVRCGGFNWPEGPHPLPSPSSPSIPPPSPS